MIGNTIPIPMASIIKVVRMKRKGLVSFIPRNDTLFRLLTRLKTGFDSDINLFPLKKIYVLYNARKRVVVLFE
tara:strand:- start:308 stop:526 length:219 start_codon:yes stop_codon:yes gene_type:complete